MAYRRCLQKRGNLSDWRNNCHPSFSYVLHSGADDKRERPNRTPSSAPGINSFIQTRSFGSSLNGSTGFGASSRHNRMLSNAFLSPCSGYSFCRHMSTVNHGADKIMTDVADVLAETTMDAVVSSQASVVNEVAIAAADSYFPVKALQYFVDSVHTYTGLNWWAAIVLTTLLIRTALVPFLINQLKSTTKLTQMRPRMEEIKARMEEKAMDPTAIAEAQREVKKLYKEYGVSPFTPLKGLLIQGPVFISFFLAITNMAEKVPSFKHGGAYWFVDLSTPDPLYILPVLTGLSFLITVECNMQEGLEGNPIGTTMKKVSRVLALVTVPLTAGFPKAIFCYWVTSNLFSLVYGLVLKAPGVKKTLGIPEIEDPEPTPAPQSPFSIFPALKQSMSARNGPSSSPDEPSKHSNKKISSSAVISQRLKSLEKQVKGRKKSIKR